MSAPNAMNANKLKIWVSDGTTGDGRWKYLCLLEQRTFARENQTDEKYLGDCADDDAVPQRKVFATGQKWSVNGTGVVDTANAGYLALRTQFEAASEIEIKIAEAVSGGQTYTGFALPTTMTVAGGMAGAATLTIALEGSGALTAVAYA